MRGLLRRQAAEGRAVLVSSHLLAEVAQSVDDVVVIARGELRGRGSLEQVLGGSDGPATEVRAKDPASLTAALERHGHTVRSDGTALIVPGATAEQVGTVAAEERLVLLGLVPCARSLEAAFLELTGGDS
jgi:ABC-2 type transport system ATP-binding protein